MVVEIQRCVNSTYQHVQRPSPTPESSGPLKKYYLASRGQRFLRWKHTEYQPKVPSSCGGNGHFVSDYQTIII